MASIILESNFVPKLENNRWLLPRIEVRPTSGGESLEAITVSVTGSPKDKALKLENNYQNEINRKAGLPRRFFESRKPLDQILSFCPIDIPEQGFIQEDFDCQLTVVVKIRTAENKTTEIQKRCRISARPLAAPTKTFAPPELKVSTIPAVVTIDDGSLIFTVEVQNPPTPMTRPTVDIDAHISPKSEIEGNIIEAVRGSLNEGLRETHVSTTSRTYETRIMLPVPSASSSVVFEVPLTVSLPGVKTVSHTLKIGPMKDWLPGWLAIDFGTSTSTVVCRENRKHQRPPGLPVEQEARLQERLRDWLCGRAPSGGLYAGQWDGFIQVIRERLSRKKNKISLEDALADRSMLYAVVLEVETALTQRTNTNELFNVLARKLNEIYREAVRIPPLRTLGFEALRIDPNTKTPEAINSNMEICSGEAPGSNGATSLGFYSIMGKQADDHWKQTVAKGPVAGTHGADIVQEWMRFIRSPKRYFGTTIDHCEIALDNKLQHVRVADLMKAGWSTLIALALEARKRDNLPDKHVRHVVVTYPTMSPPGIRAELQTLFNELGFSIVQADYDEAVAAAVFYIMQEVGGSADIGFEGFKTRFRRPNDGVPILNVLVFDIGGGTTDIALMELRLSEHGDGKGGRAYELTPKLLASSGQMQLGGELMTLQVYRLLKAALADHVLKVNADLPDKSSILERRLNQLEVHFTDGVGGYKNGSILAPLLRSSSKSTSLLGMDREIARALAAADVILPTAWKSSHDLDKRRAFYFLWDEAEQIKCRLPSKDQSEVKAWTPIESRMIGDLLRNFCGFLPQPNGAPDPLVAAFHNQDLSLRLEQADVENAIRPVVLSAVEIAFALLKAQREGQAANSPNGSWQLDKLILSGNACRLKLVDDVIRQKFAEETKGAPSEAPLFIWTSDRVTFEPEFAKLAPAMGACHAEILHNAWRHPEDFRGSLGKGVNQLRIKIRELLSSLPCYFSRDYEPLFGPKTELLRLDAQELGKARSDWLGLSLLTEIYRSDTSVNAANVVFEPWYSGNSEVLRSRLARQIDQDAWREMIKGQFEVDQRLNFLLLLCRGGNPRYLIKDEEAASDRKLSIDIPKALAQQSKVSEPTGNLSAEPGPVLEGPQAFELEMDIFIKKTGTREYETIFSCEVSLDKNFDYGPGTERQGRRGKGAIKTYRGEDALFPVGGKIEIWGRLKDSETIIPLGWLHAPLKETRVRWQYNFSIDDQGVLRIHFGAVPYLWASTLDDLIENEGSVFRWSLDPHKIVFNDEKDPFCGLH